MGQRSRSTKQETGEEVPEHTRIIHLELMHLSKHGAGLSVELEKQDRKPAGAWADCFEAIQPPLEAFQFPLLVKHRLLVIIVLLAMQMQGTGLKIPTPRLLRKWLLLEILEGESQHRDEVLLASARCAPPRKGATKASHA